MKAIPREAGRVTYSKEIRALKKISLDEAERAIIIGNILGDGCLCENWSKTNYRLIILHSIRQKEYIEWKYQMLKSWILTPPRYYLKTNSLAIRTVSHPELSVFRSVFYKEGKKTIPSNVGEYLVNPLTLAVWFMDDGNAVKHNEETYGYHLNTQSFTKSENEFLAGILQGMFGIKCTIQENHRKSRIYIGSKDRRKFASLIETFVIPSMQYKLG